MSAGGCALRYVACQLVAGRALQGSYGEASAFSVDKCARKCGSASADFAIHSLVCFQPYGCPPCIYFSTVANYLLSVCAIYDLLNYISQLYILSFVGLSVCTICGYMQDPHENQHYR